MNQITYEDISAVNAEIKTTKVKNKDYAEVPQRVKAFRKLYPMGRIETDILSLENGICVMKASAWTKDENGADMLLATGTAYEKESSSYINKTSYIENCETSAIGRALGFCGLGIDVSIASKEEVENAINNQNKMQDEYTEEVAKTKVSDTHVRRLNKAIETTSMTKEKLLEIYQVKELEDFTIEMYNNALGRLRALYKEEHGGKETECEI